MPESKWLAMITIGVLHTGKGNTAIPLSATREISVRSLEIKTIAPTGHQSDVSDVEHVGGFATN
ncbi:hypothetical protein SAMN05216344_11989 [Polaromonas sp. OV174]|uniref:hypothetical protein n=1 Tax=Polaromonas sp. OV174 TaxID=1855300 RepID=UPI0008ED0FE4|nr:hypothetical protein [Polaromonas sp. OV174]SFC49991.1 hypothetical protein SAMN05216344_11989 [Polaromonas sp. OV174]